MLPTTKKYLFDVKSLFCVHSLIHSFTPTLSLSFVVFWTELCPDDYYITITYLLAINNIIFRFFFCLTWRYYYYLLHFLFLFLFTIIIIITENIHTHTLGRLLSLCGYPLMTSYYPLTTNPLSPIMHPLCFCCRFFQPPVRFLLDIFLFVWHIFKLPCTLMKSLLPKSPAPTHTTLNAKSRRNGLILVSKSYFWSSFGFQHDMAAPKSSSPSNFDKFVTVEKNQSTPWFSV